MPHIFDKQVMTTLVNFIYAVCLLGLKHLCEWLLKVSAYFSNHFFDTLKFLIFWRLFTHM